MPCIKSKEKGFTLVELIVVLAILAILTTMALTATSGIVNQTRYDETVQVLKSMEEAIFGFSNRDGTAHGFISDTGEFPHADYSNANQIVNELVTRTWSLIPAATQYELPPGSASPTMWLIEGWNGPYIKVPYNNNNNLIIKDGWGNPIEYGYNNALGGIGEAWIRSAGPDGNMATAGDNLSRTYLGLYDADPTSGVEIVHGPDLYGTVVFGIYKPPDCQKKFIDNIEAGLLEVDQGAYTITDFVYLTDPSPFNFGNDDPPLFADFQYDHVLCGIRAVYIRVPVQGNASVPYEKVKLIKVVPGGVTRVNLMIPEDYTH